MVSEGVSVAGPRLKIPGKKKRKEKEQSLLVVVPELILSGKKKFQPVIIKFTREETKLLASNSEN